MESSIRYRFIAEMSLSSTVFMLININRSLKTFITITVHQISQQRIHTGYEHGMKVAYLTKDFEIRYQV